MKFKALKSFVSGFGTFDADEEYDVRLDKPTSKMWIEHGLIEKVKASETVQEPVQEADQEPTQETEQEPIQETEQEPVQEPVQEVEEVKPVETNEN